jgi:hypothetical protein
MYAAKIQKRANTPFAVLYPAAGPTGLPGTRHQSRQTGHHQLSTRFAHRLRTLLASMDFRQLAGPTAVFFLWPPRPRHRIPATTAQDHRRHRGAVDRHRQVM